MSKRFLMSVFILLMIFGCGSEKKIITASDYVGEYGGSLKVYEDILKETSCEKLQERFDIAVDDLHMYIKRNHEKGKKWCFGYMECSDKRMKEIGCYK